MPIGIKDMLLTAGVRTTFGSVMFEDNIPDVDEPVVRQVRDAGGDARQDERSRSSRSAPWVTIRSSKQRPIRGIPRRRLAVPAQVLRRDRRRRMPDRPRHRSAGSIRIPAAHCGIVGFKPTKGIVPDNGTNDSLTTTGPMARTVDDAEPLLSVLADFSEADPHSVPVGPLSTLRRRVDSTSARRQPGLGLRTGRRTGAHHGVGRR